MLALEVCVVCRAPVQPDVGMGTLGSCAGRSCRACSGKRGRMQRSKPLERSPDCDE